MGQDEHSEDWWISVGTALRMIVGWLSVAIGVLNLVVEIDWSTRQPDGPYLLFHAMLVIGGAILVTLGRIGPKPGTAGYLAGGVAAAAGMIVGALPATTTLCCLDVFAIRHGFPFTLMARDPGGRWHLDGPHILADLLFWGYCGLLVVVVVGMLRRVAAMAPPEPEERQYIEHRTPTQEQAEHKTNLAG